MLLSIFGLPLITFGQSSDTPKFPAKDDNAAVLLSPFVIHSSKDNGYVATQTLVGTRINTSLADLGSSISVYTKDFVSDIGVTNVNDLMVYATGMEAAGAFGNYSGASIGSDNVVSGATLSSPQTAMRTRGLATPDRTRGLFSTNVLADAYNIENVTVSRGANSILFGIGSPAGVVESTPISPVLGRNFGKAELRLDRHGSHRTILEYNRALIPAKLALRFALLDDQQEFTQRPAYEHKKRAFGTVAYEPFKSTSLRVNFESGTTRASRPLTVLPLNATTQWLAAGTPAYDWRVYDNPGQGGVDAWNSRPASVDNVQIFTMVGFAYPNNTGTAAPYSFQTTIFENVQNGPNPIINRDGVGDRIRFPAGAALPLNPPTGTRYQGFVDNSAFDFTHSQIDQTGRQGERFNVLNLAVEQRFWQNRMGVELAFNHESFVQWSRNPFFATGNTNYILVDPNKALPEGQDNPNFGRVYAVGYSQASFRRIESDARAFRATGYAKYNFADLESRWKSARWLGHHSLTLLREQTKGKSVSGATHLASEGPAATAVGGANINGFNHYVPAIVYIGDSVYGKSSLAGANLQPIRIPEMKNGDSFQTTYWDPTAQTISTATTTMHEINESASGQRSKNTATAAVLQSYFLADHLVTTFGVRKDQNYGSTAQYLWDANRPYALPPGLANAAIPDVAETGSGTTRSYSVVAKVPNKLLGLFPSAELRLFYNQSENFQPSGTRITPFGSPIPNTSGTTKEYGPNLSLFDGKLSVKVAHYETAVNNAPFSQIGSVSFQLTGNFYAQTWSYWATESNVNPGINRQGDIDTLFKNNPIGYDAYAKLYNFRLTTDAKGFKSATWSTPQGITDTTDYVATGNELEVVWNPINNLRILANVASQETVSGNSGRFTSAAIPYVKAALAALGDRPWLNYPANGGAVRPNETFAAIQQPFLDQYNVIKGQEGRASDEQRKWHVNFVANYTFTGEALRGWNIGGAYRWIDKVGIGYPYISNASGSKVIDVSHPYYGPSEAYVDLWLGYRHRIGRNLQWTARLSGSNVFGRSNPIPIVAQSDGSFANARIPPETRWSLTNTIEF
jgi:outer membrane receptor protein involved in Fe transport